MTTFKPGGTGSDVGGLPGGVLGDHGATNGNPAPPE